MRDTTDEDQKTSNIPWFWFIYGRIKILYDSLKNPVFLARELHKWHGRMGPPFGDKWKLSFSQTSQTTNQTEFCGCLSRGQSPMITSNWLLSTLYFPHCNSNWNLRTVLQDSPAPEFKIALNTSGECGPPVTGVINTRNWNLRSSLKDERPCLSHLQERGHLARDSFRSLFSPRFLLNLSSIR